MDRLAILQDAIDRADDASGRYCSNRELFEIRGEDILAGRRDGGGWAASALCRLLLDIADDHDGCTLEGCGTCTAVRKALAVSLDELRTVQQQILERRVAPARSRWRSRDRNRNISRAGWGWW